MMWDAAARNIEQSGGQLKLGRHVDCVSYDETAKIWTVSATTADGLRETYRARHVLSSAPIRELIGMLHPPAASQRAAAGLRYRDFLTVVLIGRSKLELPDNWVYIHDPSVKVGRVQNFKSWSPEMIADGESTCLGLEYFCFEGDGLWTSPDQDLIELAKTEIGKIGLMIPSDVNDACVVRQAKAYPVYDSTYASHVKAVRQEIASRYPNLHLIGRNGMHKYNNQDHAMMTGLLTALNIVAGRPVYDVWQVNEDAEYSEQGVSGADVALASERLVPRQVGES